jgi:hypothetical protein
MRHHQCPDIAINAALPLSPKQLQCFALPFFCGNGAGGGNYFEKQGVYYF